MSKIIEKHVSNIVPLEEVLTNWSMSLFQEMKVNRIAKLEIKKRSCNRQESRKIDKLIKDTTKEFNSLIKRIETNYKLVTNRFKAVNENKDAADQYIDNATDIYSKFTDVYLMMHEKGSKYQCENMVPAMLVPDDEGDHEINGVKFKLYYK